LSDHNLAVMEAADLTLLVITPDLPSVKNARLFLDLAFALDLKPDRFALVINRAATPGGLPPQQIQKLFTLPHIYTIPDDPKIAAVRPQGRRDLSTQPHGAVRYRHRTDGASGLAVCRCACAGRGACPAKISYRVFRFSIDLRYTHIMKLPDRESAYVPASKLTGYPLSSTHSVGRSVEFVTAEGETVALLTLTQTDIRPMRSREILHVREFAQAAA
jgi:hypothetical protein